MEILERVRGDHEQGDTYVMERMAAMLDAGRSQGLVDYSSCLSVLGKAFRAPLSYLSQDLSDVEVGKAVMQRYVLVHVDDGHEKLLVLCHMMKKLLAVVRGHAAPDNVDSLTMQDLWTSGMIYSCVIKEKLFHALRTACTYMYRSCEKDIPDDITSLKTRVRKAIIPIGKPMHSFMASGNFYPYLCSDFQQESGFVVMCDKINMLRFTAQFRSVHRGAYFAEMKTTTVRKLMPDSWGFLCPVHTPDGAPCGLLNHLASEARITTGTWDPKEHYTGLCQLLESCGMHPSWRHPTSAPGCVSVLIDGRVAGTIPVAVIKSLQERLRVLKCAPYRERHPHVNRDMEVVYVPVVEGSQFPGLYLFTGFARFVRSIVHVPSNKEEVIGPMQQPYMEIAVTEDDRGPDVLYRERHVNAMMSLMARLTPFPDFNQSPRNMYQCQMGKQTMGVPATAYDFRSDVKMFRLTYGQSPVVRTNAHRDYLIDDYPNGLNAVVAVLAYTGYDMEDAMIINKASYERGIASASVYYSQFIDLVEEATKHTVDHLDLIFDNTMAGGAAKTLNMDPSLFAHIDEDGLPFPGTPLSYGAVLCTFYNKRKKQHTIVKNKKIDPVIVDLVNVVPFNESRDTNKPFRTVLIKLREPRSAVIGDKFSSRHGQKGTLSRLWPQEDMPFSDSGIVPDVLINPNAFPSRMTIGMLLESMAGKSGAMRGEFQDGTAFQFSENHRAVDYFGQQLVEHGFSHYGTERMYSGILGTELDVEIFQGVVFYQRLRHMVNDKFQVRSEGPVNQLTRQPIKGRKVGGGIRVGEMERDSILGHGAAFMLNDRLFQSSDFSTCYCCQTCGSLLGIIQKRDGAPTCYLCDNAKDVEARGGKKIGVVLTLAIPFVFRYLIAELAALSIKLTLNIKQLY
jgi:DNA-directed RNA polymerase I subunit RPA2